MTGRKRKHDRLSNSLDGREVDISRGAFTENPANTTISDNPPEANITFYVGSDTRQFPLAKLLSNIWKDGLDSPCVSCGCSFTEMPGAPIRTICFDNPQSLHTPVTDITQTTFSQHPIRVNNRHFGCIKNRKIDYIPVSHVWHESVAAANQDHTDNSNAAWLAYQIPVKTLLALTKKYGPVEIWHDYLSVPQWRKETQQLLLLLIPAIYGLPQSTLVHLDDVRACYISQAFDDQDSQSFLDGLAATLRSQWFERLWVTLEYIRSNEILILTEEYKIYDVNAGDLIHRISEGASRHVQDHGQSTFMRAIRERGATWTKCVNWTDMESWKSKPDKHHTLGMATHILGLKHCRAPRDYYIALAGLIGFRPEARKGVFDISSFEFFFFLALHALKMGDYSPLLLNHLPEEAQDARAPWLHGYSQMSEWLWDLGVCHRRAQSTEIIKNGVIQPELESAGVLEWFEFSKYDGEPEDVFMKITSQILQCSGTSNTAFCSAVDRIFPLTEKKALYTEWDLANIKKPVPRTPNYNLKSIAKLLGEFSSLHYRTETPQTLRRMRELSRLIFETLQLGKSGKQSADSRMSVAQAEADWYLERFGREVDGLGRVRCKFCGRRWLLRLMLWETPELEHTQVYRIPGLLFDESVPGGIGLVVCKGDLIGKMIYGSSTCKSDCQRLERVKLGSAILGKGGRVRSWG